jgi:hypothetical protein
LAPKAWKRPTAVAGGVAKRVRGHRELVQLSRVEPEASWVRFAETSIAEVAASAIEQGSSNAANKSFAQAEQPTTAIHLTEDGGSKNRCFPKASSSAGSVCTSHLQRASGQRSGRRLMRVKRCAPISCPSRCPRKEPLHSDQRSGRVDRRGSTPILRAGRDNFRDNRAESRRGRNSRSRLYLAFSPR